MKRIVSIMAVLLACAQVFAQTTSEEFKARYERQVRNVGAAGVGVETIIDRWEEAFPGDRDATMARFSYLLNKSQAIGMVAKPQARYLGNKPSLVLKDEQGNDVNYFEEITFDADNFAESQRVIEAAIKNNPKELRFLFAKINSLVSYEKEDPVLATMEVSSFADVIVPGKTGGYTLDGEAMSEEDMINAIQEYCYTFYSIASAASFESFRSISEKMNKKFPKNPAFLDNLGSYQLVCAKNPKKAISYYKKALKLDPDDAVASANMKLAQRQLSK